MEVLVEASHSPAGAHSHAQSIAPRSPLLRRHRQLYDRVASFENLLAAAREALRGKRGRAPGAAFFAALEHQVAALHRELCEGSYRHGPYHYFQIHDPKTRTVAAADFRDRAVHHPIVRVLEPIFERRFIEDSYACRKGRGTHAAMRRAAGLACRFPYALKCDVSRYFPSIDHDVLFEQVELWWALRASWRSCSGTRRQSGSNRGLRGGSFNNNANNLAASTRNDNNPTNENNNIGFRVASPRGAP
jgi:hypothetical protein